MDSDLIDAVTYEAGSVDIESIMRQIRKHLAQKHGKSVNAPVATSPSSTFSAEVYEELYYSNQVFDKLYVAPYLTPVQIPVLGALWQRVRSQFHAVCVFYVNRLAEAQIRFNGHVVRTLNGMVREIDDHPPDRIQKLERQVQQLERRLESLEQTGAAVDMANDGQGDR